MNNYNKRNIKKEIMKKQMLDKVKQIKAHSPSELRLVAFVVDRDVNNKDIHHLQKYKLAIQYIFYCEGTNSEKHADFWGFGKAEKKLVFGLTLNTYVDSLMLYLDRKFSLSIKQTGIAFTIPLSGIVLEKKDHIKEYKDNLINTEDNTMEYNKELIVTIVDDGYSDDVIFEAKKAGVDGATIFPALRNSDSDLTNLFGIPVQEKKNIVIILTEIEDKYKIIESINNVETASNKIIFTLPVDKAVGLETI